MTDRKKKPVLVEYGNSGAWYQAEGTEEFDSTAAAEKWLQENAEHDHVYRIVTVERSRLTLTVETKRKLTNG